MSHNAVSTIIAVLKKIDSSCVLKPNGGDFETGMVTAYEGSFRTNPRQPVSLSFKLNAGSYGIPGRTFVFKDTSMAAGIEMPETLMCSYTFSAMLGSVFHKDCVDDIDCLEKLISLNLAESPGRIDSFGTLSAAVCHFVSRHIKKSGLFKAVLIRASRGYYSDTKIGLYPGSNQAKFVFQISTPNSAQDMDELSISFNKTGVTETGLVNCLLCVQSVKVPDAEYVSSVYPDQLAVDLLSTALQRYCVGLAAQLVGSVLDQLPLVQCTGFSPNPLLNGGTLKIGVFGNEDPDTVCQVLSLGIFPSNGGIGLVCYDSEQCPKHVLDVNAIESGSSEIFLETLFWNLFNAKLAP